MEKNTKAIISLAILALFAFAYAVNPHDEMLKTALVGALGVVTGYWLGGSKIGADTAVKNSEIVSAAALSSEVQAVEVVNNAQQPVPVETK